MVRLHDIPTPVCTLYARVYEGKLDGRLSVPENYPDEHPPPPDGGEHFELLYICMQLLCLPGFWFGIVLL